MTEPAEELPETPEQAAEASPEAIARALQAVIAEKDVELAAMKDQALRECFAIMRPDIDDFKSVGRNMSLSSA